MRKFLMLAALLASGALATPAAAQDGTFRVGAIGGFDSVKLSDGVDSESDSGTMYGAVVGYDFSFGPAFVGLEGEYADSSTGVTFDDVLVAGDRVSLTAGRDLYLGGRLGVTAGMLRFYAKAGYTNARAKGRYTDGTTSVSEHIDLDGWRIGAGVEVPLGPVGLRFEARHSDYGEAQYQDIATGITARRTQVVAGFIAGF